MRSDRNDGLGAMPKAMPRILFEKHPKQALTPPATFLKRHIQSGPVAQLVEQLTFNQWVSGSNPDGLTTEFKGLGRNA